MERLTARDSIIEAAKKLFTKHGYKKTSMMNIALMVHKTKSSIYHYFKSKEEIFAAIAEKEANELRRALYEAIKKEDTSEKKLSAYILARQEGYSKLASLYEALHSDIFADFTLVEYIRNKYDKDEYNTIKMILRSGIKKGLFYPDINIDITIKTILAVIKGFEIKWAKNSDKEENKKELDGLINIIFYGIINREK